MKKATLLSALLTMTVILTSGCTKSQINKDLDKTIADIQKQVDEQVQDNNRIMENLNNMMTQGGQPGLITLNGVAVLDADKLDSRITVLQSTGLTRAGSETALAENTVALNSLKAEENDKLTTDIKTLEDKRTYINFGCKLAESEIAGLTEVSATTSPTTVVLVAKASRVFICGELNVSDKIFFDISASDIMLKDASILTTNNPGRIALSSKTLVLIGKNKITTIAKNDSGYVLQAALIKLTVTTEIYGDGTLALESKGGNNISEAKTEEAKKDSK